MLSSIVLALVFCGSNVALAATSTSYASRPTFSTIEPSLASIYATQATATSLSPVSNVKGAAFDRIVQIWLENTVGQICLEFKRQLLMVLFRTMIKLPQTQICNGLQAKEFYSRISGPQPILPSRKFYLQRTKVSFKRLMLPQELYCCGRR
jgi:hypothetical protein